MKLILIFALTVATVLGADVAKTPAKQGDAYLRQNLMKTLMENYDRGINPDSPNVKFGLSLLTFSINEDTSTMDPNVWLKMTWRDSRLAWDTKVFPIETLRVQFSNLWHPDIRLFNSGSTFSTDTSCVETNAVLYPSGEVIWIPPCNLNSLCKTTLKAHPFEPQVCTLKFGSWTYDSLVMDVNFWNETSIDLSEFQDLSEWKLLASTGVKNTKTYPCCVEPYTDLTFNITIQRKPEHGSC